jgi:hypothetical protein
MLLSLFAGASACHDQSALVKNSDRLSAQSEKLSDSVDSSFDSFIKKFNSDSMFQMTRIKFPLKTTSYKVDTDTDTTFYINNDNFQRLDFYDNRNQSKVKAWKTTAKVNEQGKDGQILLQGIENGIDIVYLFEKIDGEWTLVAVEDRST